MAAKQGYGADLRKFMDLRVDLRLNGDRRVAGILKGYDQFLNIVLDEAIEIPSQKQGAKKAEGQQEQQRDLGTIVIRGSSVQLWENIDKVQ
jgi:small nuclear ribonucleoprotein G